MTAVVLSKYSQGLSLQRSFTRRTAFSPVIPTIAPLRVLSVSPASACTTSTAAAATIGLTVSVPVDIALNTQSDERRETKTQLTVSAELWHSIPGETTATEETSQTGKREKRAGLFAWGGRAKRCLLDGTELGE